MSSATVVRWKAPRATAFDKFQRSRSDESGAARPLAAKILPRSCWVRGKSDREKHPAGPFATARRVGSSLFAQVRGGQCSNARLDRGCSSKSRNGNDRTRCSTGRRVLDALLPRTFVGARQRRSSYGPGLFCELRSGRGPSRSPMKGLDWPTPSRSWLPW